MDLQRFPQLFGQNIYPGGQPPRGQQKWCAKFKPPQNTSVQECAGGCALARSTDDLSRWAGCAPSPVPISSVGFLFAWVLGCLILEEKFLKSEKFRGRILKAEKFECKKLKVKGLKLKF
jgi:hypothetical protein